MPTSLPSLQIKELGLYSPACLPLQRAYCVSADVPAMLILLSCKKDLLSKKLLKGSKSLTVSW